MNMNDKLSLDISNDPEMKDYLATKSVGDDCEFTITVSMDENTGEQAVFSVKDVAVNSYKDVSDAPPPPADAGDAPVLMILGKKLDTRKKGGDKY